MPQHPNPNGLVNQAKKQPSTTFESVAPAAPERGPEVPTYTAPALTETGQGTQYTGRTGEQILAGTQKGLVSLLEREGPLLSLARAKGARSAEARGLGGSSLRERAAEGAVYDVAVPLVTQAQELGSREQIAAQQATATAQIAASQRRLSELQQQQDLAARSGDSAAARQLERDVRQEENRMQGLLQAQTLSAQSQAQEEARIQQTTLQERDIGARATESGLTREQQTTLQASELAARAEESGLTREQQTALQASELGARATEGILTREQQTALQASEIEASAAERNLDRELQGALQETDIDYRKWLEQATFEHTEVLQTSQLAADTYRSFNDNATQILNNPETTPEQKKAALAALKEGLTAGLKLIEGVSGIDLTKYLPSLIRTGTPPPSLGSTTGLTGGSRAEFLESRENGEIR